MKILSTVFIVLAAMVILVVCDQHSQPVGEAGSPGESLSTELSPGEPVRDNQSRDIAQSRTNAITQAVERVAPAVVGISIKGVEYYRRSNPFFNDPFFRMFFPDMDEIYRSDFSAVGSGFIISPDGYIVTNEHVVEKAQEITVTLTSKEKYTARLENSDYYSDVALLKIDGENFPYIEMGNSDDIIVGEWVIALGNPFGLFEINDQPSVTVGVVSATGRDFGRNEEERFYNDMIQTDASINTGNSGGPLVNSVGEVIGVNSFILTGNSSQQGSIGLGFAIPINMVRDIVEELRTTAGQERGYYTGIDFYEVRTMTAIRLGYNSTEGAVIVSVDPNSPGEAAGLRKNDIITEVNGSRISEPNDITVYINRENPRPGKTVTFTFFRTGSLYKTEVTLAPPVRD
ncbi:S1C family serine protease [candidate division KSB1 bacterium]